MLDIINNIANTFVQKLKAFKEGGYRFSEKYALRTNTPTQTEAFGG